jgi:iron complex transport system permease protein
MGWKHWPGHSTRKSLNKNNLKKSLHPILINLILLVIVMLLSIAIGSVVIPLRTVLQVLFNTGNGNSGLSTFTTIIWELRIPRTILMVLVGASLAGSGCAYQGLFRNPLADPYLIGAASGAGLGAVLAITIHWPGSLFGFLTVPLAAFVGAILTVLIVFSVSRMGKTTPITTLILAGVAVSSFATALTSYLLINASGELRRALVWLVGGSTLSGWMPVLGAAPYIVLGLATLLSMGHALNVLQFGDEQARQLGLRVPLFRTLIILAATLATAAAVAFSGIIGFVGLIVPHVMRNLWGSDYRRLLPLSILGGASFLLAADILARILLAPQELPVGIITALAGAPFFLFLLRKSKQQYW